MKIILFILISIFHFNLDKGNLKVTHRNRTDVPITITRFMYHYNLMEFDSIPALLSEDNRKLWGKEKLHRLFVQAGKIEGIKKEGNSCIYKGIFEKPQIKAHLDIRVDQYELIDTIQLIN